MRNSSRPSRKLFIATGLIVGLFGMSAILNGCGGDDTDVTDNTDSTNTPSPSVPGTFDVGASMASQFGPAVTKGQALSTSDMTTSTPLIPSDIYRPSSGTEGPTHQDLATFAWLEFISLVSPMGTTRGETGGSFESSGKAADTTLVWESYQHRSELFPYVAGQSGNGRAPAPWDQAPDYQMFYKDSNKVEQKLDIPYSNYNNLDETTQIGMNILYFPADPGTMNPEGDYQVLFEAKVNQQEWNFANTNYTKFGDFNTNFPNGIDFDAGTIEVKATWRPLESIDSADRHRYHVTQAIYYTGEDDDPSATVGNFALIGLHIIHKTANYPTFVFATFEQVDNLSSPTSGSTGLYYVPTYDEISYTLPDSTTTSNPTATVANPAYPSGWLNAPYAEPSAGNKIDLPVGAVTNIAGATTIPVTGGSVVGIPVTQPATTNEAVDSVNAAALTAMQGIPGFDDKFIWQYYQLKGVQGVPTNNEMDHDYYLANIVTESSVPGIQLFTGGQGISNRVLGIPRNQANVRDSKQSDNILNQGGCQGCHGIAQTGSGFDFSFLYFSKTSGFSPEVQGLTSAELTAARTAKYMMMLNPNKE